MDTISICKNSKNTKQRSKTRQLENIIVNNNNTIKEAFPWLLKFNKIVYSSTGNRNYQHLKQLLFIYTQNVLSSVETSNVKFSDANIILKNNISNILIFFHLYWLDIKQEITDYSLYLNKISVLLSVYIDMELQTSRQEIVIKILSLLYIYLNNSEEHIFRVLLRIKHMTEKYTQICNHIFMKSFTNLKIKTTSLTDVAYIRYLLAFKMWKKMEKIFDEKEKIDKLALMILGPRMPKLRDELLEFVPRPPMNEKNETLWLLKSNLFDLKQTKKYFLLFEDKMDEYFLLSEDQMDKYSLLLEDKINSVDNSTDLQCTKVYINQNCLKSQKQMNLLYQSNPNKSNLISDQEVNEDYLNGLQNNNTSLNINGNKSLEQTYLQKKKRKNLKSLKKIRKKPGKIINIDLTGDNEIINIDLTGDDEISVPCKIKRKETKHNLECLKIMKNMKNEKHINPLKHSTDLMTSMNTEKSSNSKNTIKKVCLEHKSTPSNSKISDSTESYTSISNKSSLNNIYHNDSEKEHLNVIKNQINNTYTEFMKKDETQFDYNSHYLKPSMFVDQNIKGFKVTTNLLKESKPENHHDVSSHMTGNAISLCNNAMMQNKETLTSQKESVIDTIPLLKMCQNDIANQHSFKQEIPINTNCSAMSYKCWETIPRDIKHLRVQKLKPTNDHNLQIKDYYIIQEKVYHQKVNEYEDYCTKIDCKPFVLSNSNDNIEQEHNTFTDNENVKLPCDTKIIYILSDCNVHMHVVHHIDDIGIVTYCDKQAEKKLQCLHNSNDMYNVSTTFSEDQIKSLDGQNVNLDNNRKYDYEHDSKHSETMIKIQQGRNDCDTSTTNDRLHLSEHFFYNIDSIDMDLKEANEIMKVHCINDFENINFSHNQIEILENLENVVSKETTDFLLSSKQSPFVLDNIHTNTLLSEKDILYNQNNTINSNVNPTVFNLNNITTNDILL